MNWLELRIPPPILFILTALMMWGCAWILPIGTISIPMQKSLFTLLFIMSGLVGLLSFFTFIKERANLHPMHLEQTSVLITQGIYRISRNPMYLSLAGILVSWGIILSNLFALCCPLLFILYITRFQIQPEERILMTRFPEQFQHYKQTVRRWL